MSDAATKTDLTGLENRIDKRFDKFDARIEVRFEKLMAVMSQFAQDVDKRFDSVDVRLAKAEYDVADLKSQFKGIG